jgi:hypothetical protein
MRGFIPCLAVLATLGCEGSNEIAGPQRPTPRPFSYRIAGRVTNNGRASLATLRATSGGRQWSTKSNSRDGQYEFTRLPAGTFVVSASAGYCGTKKRTVTVPPDARLDFQFAMCWLSPDERNLD